jgi:hypothetical protein
MHHFGLDFFSISGAHWVLHAALTHSINDALFVLSFASDASALAASDLRGIEFIGDKTCPVGAASLIGSCRAKSPLSAHPARLRAKSATNSRFMFAPIVRRFIMPSQQALDDMNLRRRLPISLICPRSINRRGRAAILQAPVLLLAPSGS